MRKFTTALVALGCSAAMLVTAPSALAASKYVQHPTSNSTGWVRDNYWYRACDNDVDGKRARLHYYTVANPHVLLYSGWAPSQGCTEWAGATLGFTISRFRICVEQEGCSVWKNW